MKTLLLRLMALSLLFVGCKGTENAYYKNDLNSVKNDFIKTIFSSEVEEGPFFMDYQIMTIFFSNEFISLFGMTNVYDCLPHARHYYEGRSFVKTNGRYKEIFLKDLFVSCDQKEFLRSYCEDVLKKNKIAYFTGNPPLKKKLEIDDLDTFVIDDHFLVIVFQPYVVGGGEDGPFFVKIPFDELEGHWDPSHVLFPLLSEIVASNSFVIPETSFYRPA